MRNFLLLVFLSVQCSAFSQTFINNWEGNWKGELQWFKPGDKTPQKVTMQLRIHPASTANTWTWQMIYGEDEKDNRPYLLKMMDSTGKHWVIDEQNDIVMDQYWVGNKFCGVFTVMGNSIVNNLWMQGDELMVEFLSYASEAISKTGKGNEESPYVLSYRIGGYQLARLKRVK